MSVSKRLEQHRRTSKPVSGSPRATASDAKAVEVELRLEELEERIAPRLATNHNESLVADR